MAGEGLCEIRGTVLVGPAFVNPRPSPVVPTVMRKYIVQRCLIRRCPATSPGNAYIKRK